MDCFLLLLLVHTVKCVENNIELLPQIGKSVPELTQYWGYPSERHEATTVDGYILALHRIPHGRHAGRRKEKKRPVIFLLHGLLSCSGIWVTNLPHQSLAFMLADAGFDVWMGNVRGNTYSKKHLHYDTHSRKFWDFSIEEMAKYDLPAMVDAALNATGQSQLYYVGHSQGTLISFMGQSENRELQMKMKMVFALAPIARLYYIQGTLKSLARFTNLARITALLLNVHEVFPHWKVMDVFTKLICPISEGTCEFLPQIFGTRYNKYLNRTRLPVYYSYLPAGTSIGNLQHYGQLVQSGRLQKYDYGYWLNYVKYGTHHPPLYYLGNVPTPTVLFSGLRDTVSDPRDVQWTARHIPALVQNIIVPDYEHSDFHKAINANKVVNRKIINFVRDFENNNIRYP